MIGLVQHNPRVMARSRKIALMALVCLALLLLLTVVQTVHMHPRQADTDHCPLCMVLHAAAPIAAAAAVLLLGEMRAPAPASEDCQVIRLWFKYLFTRPPPLGC